MAAIDENSLVRKKRADEFMERLSDLVKALIVDHTSLHVEDSVALREREEEFTEFLIANEIV